MTDIFNANNPAQEVVRVHKLNDLHQASIRYEEELNRILDEDQEYRREFMLQHQGDNMTYSG